MKQYIKALIACLTLLLWGYLLYAQPNITRVEYYLDHDPGYNDATAVSIAPGADLSNVTINIDPATLSYGIHLMGVRARDANGDWSHDNKWLFVKPSPGDLTGPGIPPNLKKVEYYIDNDPGYGNGTQVAISNVSDISDYNLLIDISGLITGSHTLFIRSKDANGAWSLDNQFNFTVAVPTITINSVSKTSMCVGEAFSVSFNVNGSFNSGNVFTAQLSNSTGSFSSPTDIGTVTGTTGSVIQCTLPATLSSGTGYRVRVVSSDPTITSTNSSDPITVNTLPATPTITANGPTTFCQGGSVQLTSSAANGYQWSNGATTQSITVNSADSYRVTVANSNGCTATSNPTVVTVYALPTTPVITASGPATFCQGGSVMLTSSAAASYQWSTGATTQSITVSAGGNYTVTVANSNGCTATSAPTAVVVNAKPTPTTTPTGTVTINSGSSTTIRVNESFTAYHWSTGSTTQIITISTAGSYTCTVTNNNGCQGTTAPVVVTVSNCAKPTITASGPVTNLCPGATVTLTASKGNSYLWNTGATTQKITVTTAGSYYATVTKACGSSTSDPTVVTYQSCGNPTGLTVSSITKSSANLSWTGVSCSTNYNLQYKKSNTTSWTTVVVRGTSRIISKLSPATTYNWRVQTVCTSSSTSNYTTGNNFTTTASLIAGVETKTIMTATGSNWQAIVYPNPASTNAVLKIKGTFKPVTVILSDLTGRTLWKAANITSTHIELPVATLNASVYLITITDGKETKVLKLVKGQE